MNTFSMTYEEVEALVNQLSKYADAIKEDLDKVTTESNRVTEDTWRGKAAESYKSSFDTLRPKFDLFYATIQDCINYLTTAIGKNKSEDTNVSSTFAE